MPFGSIHDPSGMRFANRREAGRALAQRLADFAGRSDVIVLGLPRGGVPVAAEVARALGAPLDACVVRKLGVPGLEEVAMGAIASGGVRVLVDEVFRWRPEGFDALEEVTARELRELARREEAYRGIRPFPDLRGKTVLLVDDGLATGATMRAAIARVRAGEAGQVIVAVPVGAANTCERLAREADEVVVLLASEDFGAVGQFYADFSQTTDEEVCALLAQ